MTSRQAYWRLGLVLLIYSFLSLAHSIWLPLQHGPDELAHFQYSRFIAQNGRMPLSYKERQEAGYKAGWPPLYHILVAALAGPGDDDAPPRIRIASASQIINSEDELMPYRGDVLLWHVGRFSSMVFGAGTIILTFLITLEICPDNYRLATLSAAIIALVPNFIFVSSSMADDALLGFMVAFYLWILVKIVKGDTRLKMYIGLGAVMGVSVTVKYATAVLPLQVVTVFAYLAWRYKWGWSTWLRRVALVAIAAILASSWWFIFLVTNFNEISEYGLAVGTLKPILASGVDATQDYFASRLTGGQIGSSNPRFEQSPFWLWGAQIYQSLWAPKIGEYPLGSMAHVMIGLVCVAAVTGLARAWRCWPENRIWIGFGAFHAITFLIVPLLRFISLGRINETAQGRHLLLPVAAILPLLMVYGWRVWLSPKMQRRLALAVVGGLACWSMVQLIRIATYYDSPIPVRTTAYAASTISHPLDKVFGDDWLLLKGYNAQVLPSKGALKLELYWYTQASHISQDYLRKVQLVSNGQVWLEWLTYPTDGVYRTRRWRNPDTIRDEMWLPLANLPAGRYRVHVQLLDKNGPLPVEGKNTLILDEIVVSDLPAIEPDVPLSIEVDGREVVSGLKLWPTKGRTEKYQQEMSISFLVWQNQLGPNERVEWLLVDENGVMYPTQQGSAHFRYVIINKAEPAWPDDTVNVGWPSGNYRLRAEVWRDEVMVASQETEPLVTVDNSRPHLLVPPLVPDPLEANFADRVKLLGYHLPARSLTRKWAVPVTLYWQGLRKMDANFTVFAKLLDSDQQQVWTSAERWPADGYATGEWWQNEVVVDEFELITGPDIPSGIYWLDIGLYLPVDQSSVFLPLIFDGQPSDVTSVTFGPIKIGGPPPGVVLSPAEVNPHQPRSIKLGDPPLILLHGYDLTDENNQPIQNPKSKIQNLKVTFYWESLAQTSIDWSVFAHLRNQAGETVAQKDGPVGSGQTIYPTSLWTVGEIIADEVIIPLPPELPPGEYSLVVGLYNLADGLRLAVPDSVNNEVTLTTWELNP